jgi:hypothetical protein
MVKILKFKKKSLADNFIQEVNPDKIASFVQKDNPKMPHKIVDAMALAMIYTTYLQLLIDEQSISSDDIVFAGSSFPFGTDGKKTFH